MAKQAGGLFLFLSCPASLPSKFNAPLFLILFGEGMLAFWPRSDSILAGKDAFGGFAADSQTTPLQRGEDGGRMLFPEAMKALDDQFENQPRQQNVNQSSPLPEEEWQRQEARRQREETARQWRFEVFSFFRLAQWFAV